MDLLYRRDGFNEQVPPKSRAAMYFYLYLYGALGVDGHSSVWLDLESADGIFFFLAETCLTCTHKGLGLRVLRATACHATATA